MTKETTEALGMDDFKMLRTLVTREGKTSIYCDKSLLIQDLLDSNTQVTLFTRPRRFGKTLNMSMLNYFFGTKEPLFEGLKIMQYPKIMVHQGAYPVLFLTFKHIKKDTIEKYEAALRQTIYETFQSYRYLLDSPKVKVHRNLIRPYFSKDFTDAELGMSLKYLTQALQEHHDKPVIFLLDEYDTPLHKAYEKDYFADIITDFSNLLGAVLKGNTAIFKGVVTGITRVAKENIFSDLNNPGIYDIAHPKFSQYFGFTEDEVKTLIDPEHLDEIREWYNGYAFGNKTTIYNPWSILSYLDHQGQCQAYWINTSSNDLIKRSLTADKMGDIQTLIEGGVIEHYYDPHIVLRDLDRNNNAFWNLLYAAGYLTSTGEGSWTQTKMKIPNKEILYFFENIVQNWFGNGQGIAFLKAFLEDLVKGHVMDLQTKLQDLIFKTMSFRDVGENTQESFYHGLLLEPVQNLPYLLTSP